MATLGEIFDQGMQRIGRYGDTDTAAGVRGFGNGVSMGLTRYPAAAMMMGLDKVMGDGKLSYRQALHEIRLQDQGDYDNHFKSRLAGEVGGNVALAAGTGGGGALANVAKTAAMGGVSGFTGREHEGDYDDISSYKNEAADTGTGVALGTVFGGAAAGVSKVASKVANTAAVRSIKELTEKALGRKLNVQELAAVEAEAAGNTAAQNAKLIAENEATKAGLIPRVAAAAGKSVVGAVEPAVVGGTLGGAYGAFNPDEGILSGAAKGAAGAVALQKARASSVAAKQLKSAATNIVGKNPNAVPAAAGFGGRLATEAAVPTAMGAYVPKESSSDMDPWEVPAVPADASGEKDPWE